MDSHKYMMVACAVLARECYQCAAASGNTIDLTIVEQGLHDIGADKMSSALQREIDAIDTDQYEAILLGYGLCNNGIRSLRARIPMVLPRAHDCITLLMGSKEKYLRYFKDHPGTYYRSVGWTERAGSSLSNPQSTTRGMGMTTYAEYVEKYGEENARYLMDVLNDHLNNYSRLAYIDTGIPNTDQHEQDSRDWADEQGWEFSKLEGDTGLLSRLMAGAWSEDEFLIVQPGQTVGPSYDDAIVTIKDIEILDAGSTGD